MVKWTTTRIAKHTAGHNQGRADEIVEHYLSRPTHLPCQNQDNDSIVILNKIENFNFTEKLNAFLLRKKSSFIYNTKCDKR
jgi:hypothetical protein